MKSWGWADTLPESAASGGITVVFARLDARIILREPFGEQLERDSEVCRKRAGITHSTRLKSCQLVMSVRK